MRALKKTIKNRKEWNLVKNMFKKYLFAFALFSAFLFVFTSVSFASNSYADGDYSVDYTILKADNDSASMANDYFLKPAKLSVNNGQMKVQIELKNSSWIKSLEVGGVVPTVVSEDTANDRRVVEFAVSDLSQPIESKMHIKFKTPDLDYDNHYTVRFAFDDSSLPNANSTTEQATEHPAKENNAGDEKANNSSGDEAGDEQKSTDESAEKADNSSTNGTDHAGNGEGKTDSDQSASDIENPKTSDNMNMVVIGTIFSISVLFLVYKISRRFTLRN